MAITQNPRWNTTAKCTVYDADQLDDFKDMQLKQRFALCPWGVCYVDMKPT